MLVCRQSIRYLTTQQLILLTGTPIQNNMLELYSIMNLVKPEEFNSPDAFLARFGNPPSMPSTPEQLQDLQVRAARNALQLCCFQSLARSVCMSAAKHSCRVLPSI
jgi:SNF2-related domain